MHTRLGTAEDPTGIARPLIGTGTANGPGKTTIASMGTARQRVPALLPPLVTQGEIGTETMRLGIAEDRITNGGIDPTGTTGEDGDQLSVAAWEC